MICVTTRFQLKHLWVLAPMYLIYHGMRQNLAKAPGLIRYAFLIQSPITCYTLSIWESEAAMAKFANTPTHVNAVRFAKRWCRDIWSAYWRIDAISKYARRWQGAGVGQGQWPPLEPHPSHPWRLVPPHADMLPEVIRHVHREP